jgi:hypothetical protein
LLLAEVGDEWAVHFCAGSNCAAKPGWLWVAGLGPDAASFVQDPVKNDYKLNHLNFLH